MAAGNMTPIIANFVSFDPAPDESPMASWEDMWSLYQTYEEIWERDARWLMGHQILPQIVAHWVTNLPKPESRQSIGPI